MTDLNEIVRPKEKSYRYCLSRVFQFLAVVSEVCIQAALRSSTLTVEKLEGDDHQGVQKQRVLRTIARGLESACKTLLRNTRNCMS